MSAIQRKIPLLILLATLAFLLLLFGIWASRQLYPPHVEARSASPAKSEPTHQTISVKLKRGSFDVLIYPAQLDASLKYPKAIILFESGGGGWCWWEDKVCTQLQKDGYEIMGIDARVYSLTEYDVHTLQQDFQTIAQVGMKSYGDHPLPLIVGGWSTGAEQAVAVGGGPNPPTNLTGLLLIAPGSWGGYGWYASHDYGPRLVKKHTFALSDFGPRLTPLRIVQWHASLDILDSRSWLKSLKAPHREYDLDHSIHDFGGVSDEFLARLNESLDWILDKNPVSQHPATP